MSTPSTTTATTVLVVGVVTYTTWWWWSSMKWRNRRQKSHNKSSLLASSSLSSSLMNVQVECVCGNVCLLVNYEYSPVHLVCYCDDCHNYSKWLSSLRLKKEEEEEQEQEQSRRRATKKILNLGNDDSLPVEEEDGETKIRKEHQQQPKQDNKIRPVVDSEGGSRTCQVYRYNVSLIRGSSNLLQSSYLDPSKVPSSRPQRMYRIHTKCCLTPLCSAYWNELPVMGIYAANMKITTTTTNTTNTTKSKEECINNDNNHSRRYFISQHPIQKVWDDNTNLQYGIPAPEYRINCKYAKKKKGEEETTTTLLKGHPEFPPTFLIRFLWRNFVLGGRLFSTNTRRNNVSDSATTKKSQQKFTISVGDDISTMRTI